MCVCIYIYVPAFQPPGQSHGPAIVLPPSPPVVWWAPPPLWCGGGVVLSPSPPVVWWGVRGAGGV